MNRLRDIVPLAHEFVNGDTAVSCFEYDMFASLCTTACLHCGCGDDDDGDEVDVDGCSRGNGEMAKF